MLTADLQRSYVGELVTLYQLDCTNFPSGTILYFTATADGNADVIFNGVTYTAVEIEADGFQYNTNGAFPTPTLRLSNVTNYASSLVIANQDLIGAKLIRIRTLRQYLDDGSAADPQQIFAPDVYFVEQKTKHTRTSIEWKLSSAVDQQGTELPNFVLVRDFCSRVYRTYDSINAVFNYNHATCPYNDSINAGAMFDVTNVSTVNPTLDRCPKTLPGCKVRFGVHGDLPFKGLPGLGRYR